MASLAEIMMQQTSEANQKVGEGWTENFARGSELALKKEELARQRDTLQQQKAQLELAKLEKLGGWLETASKMPEGTAKKAFTKSFIPQGISAIGLADKLNPIVQEMLIGDPELGAYLKSGVEKGDIDLQKALSDPAYLAGLAKDAKEFGDAEAMKQGISSNLGQLQEASKFATEEANKRDRALIQAKMQERRQSATQEGRNIDQNSSLRKEYTAHPITKRTIELGSGYEGLRTNLTSKASAASDVSAVFQYMKILDPGSTVREGEQAQARNAAGIPDRIRNYYNQALSGQTLNPTQRKELLSAAKGLYNTQIKKQESVDKRFSTIAKKQGADPTLIVGTGFEPEADQKEIDLKFVNGGGAAQVEQRLKILAKKKGVDVNQIRKELGM